MSNIRKLSTFRQLSLNCEPTLERRKTFKKQFSEDIPKIKEKLFENANFKICLTAKARVTDQPPPIKMAWEEKNAVVVTKCQENVRKTANNSVEKDSILHSKHQLAERLCKAFKAKQEKPNLNIFLAQNTEEVDTSTSLFDSPERIFHLQEAAPNGNKPEIERGPKPTETVMIRPLTAATKREMFKKRTNSAFHSSVKDTRPILTRSSSAPTKPEAKPKFLANKRKLKTIKRKEIKASIVPNHDNNKENPKNKRELNRYVPVNGTDIVTMVSLVSPAGSDNEEVVEIIQTKSAVKDAKKVEAVKTTVSLRKTVKSVSFQQSSIHAIRSFSASFPARRTSIPTAYMLNTKIQEKRCTNVSDEDDERSPKRRLLKSQSGDLEDSLQEEQKPLPLPSQENAVCNLEVKPNEPKSEKEKECWDMYCKMTDKGVKISYDTILRGMLTPTEYRLRKRDKIREEGGTSADYPSVIPN